MYRTRIALGIATAALAVTSFVSPFMPAAEAQAMFKPDIRVNYDTQHHYDDKRAYHFRAANVGTTSVEGVAFVAHCYYMQTNGSLRHTTQYLLPANFPQNKVVTRIVNCPKESAQSVKASLRAVVQDDLTPENNSAHAPNPLPWY
jgi:hypothetical protein